MRLADALEVINEKLLEGYMVSFERAESGFLTSDHFPDVRSGEDAIATEDEAWELARKFAAKTRGKCVNIYVITRKDFTPVEGYQTRMIHNR